MPDKMNFIDKYLEAMNPTSFFILNKLRLRADIT